MKTNIILSTIFSFILFFLGFMSLAWITNLYEQIDGLVTSYEHELRIQHEYQKACEMQVLLLEQNQK